MEIRQEHFLAAGSDTVDFVGRENKYIAGFHRVNRLLGGILPPSTVYYGDLEAGVGVFGVGTCSHRHICTPHSQQGLAALQHQFSYLQYHKTTPIVK